MSKRLESRAIAIVALSLLACSGGLRPATAAGSTAAECQLYGGGVLDAGGQSAVYLFSGDRPLCNDAALKQRFCAALQTRLGYDTVRERAEQPVPVEIANALEGAERAFFLAQYPPQALEKAIAACGLKQDQVRAKAALDADLKFLRRELPSAIEPLWKRECAGRVSGTDRCGGGEGRGVRGAYNGNAIYESFCKRTTTADKVNSPGRFGG